MKRLCLILALALSIGVGVAYADDIGDAGFVEGGAPWYVEGHESLLADAYELLTEASSLVFALFGFDDTAQLPSVENLPAAMTINGVTVYPSLRYKGADATSTSWPAWGYGKDLGVQGASGSITAGSPTPLAGDTGGAPLFPGGASGKYFQEATTSAGITTGDFVIEAVFKASDATEVIAGDWTSDGAGWALYHSAINVYNLRIVGGTAEVNIPTTSGATPDGSWVHYIIFCDRSDSTSGCTPYVNGVDAGGTNPTSETGSLATSDKFTVGARTDGAVPHSAEIAYVAMWTAASWLDDGEQAEIASDRFQRLTGFYPSRANGTAAWQVHTRSTSAYVDIDQGDGTTDLFLVGPEWLRVAKRGGVTGYLAEAQATNLALQNQTFDNAAWTKSEATVSPDAGVAPDGTTTADKIIPTAVNGLHLVYQSSANATAITYTYGVYAKAAGYDYVYMRDHSGTNYGATFRLSTCSLVAAEAGATAITEDYGGGWCRIGIVGTAGVNANALRLYVSDDADGTGSYSGDTTSGVLFWAPTFEAGAFWSSPILTTSAAVSRTADQLRFTAGDNIGGEDNGQGTVVATVLCQDYDSALGLITTISDGGSASDYILASISATSDNFDVNVRASGGDNGDDTGTSDITDGAAHEVRLTWTTNDLRAYVDGTAEDTGDTSVTIPDDLDRIDIGSLYTMTYQPNCLISNIQIYSKPVAP
jgi:hypothetical protein